MAAEYVPHSANLNASSPFPCHPPGKRQKRFGESCSRNNRRLKMLPWIWKQQHLEESAVVTKRWLPDLKHDPPSLKSFTVTHVTFQMNITHIKFEVEVMELTDLLIPTTVHAQPRTLIQKVGMCSPTIWWRRTRTSRTVALWNMLSLSW